MKLKSTLIIVLVALGLRLNAQSLNNVYEDTKHLENIFGTNAPFTTDSARWDSVIKKYIPKKNQVNGETIFNYIERNPFIQALNKDTANKALTVGSSTQIYGEIFPGPPPVSLTQSTSTFSASSVADALTNLIIERAKEELTATFFQNLQKELRTDSALADAFPKTTLFINQIQAYQFNAYLSALRQAFFSDINNIPFQIGAILRSPQIKRFIAQNPGAKDVWVAVPLLQFLGEMHNGKSIADAIKALYPDPELYSISPEYYHVLKLAVVLSESVRDVSDKNNWVSGNDISSLLSSDKGKYLFFALLYESTKYLLTDPNGNISITNNYITLKNINNVENLLKSFGNDYNSANELYHAYDSVKTAAQAGKQITLTQAIALINSAETDLKVTFNDINNLAPATEKFTGNADIYFTDFSQLLAILGNFNDKNYSSGVMNSMILLSQYIGPKSPLLTPFKNKTYLVNISAENKTIKSTVQLAITNLNVYAAENKNDNITLLIGALKSDTSKLSATPTADQIAAINQLFAQIKQHTYSPKPSDYDANVTYQKLLKYGTFMASLAEAKTSADLTAAMESAILPVGSSSIKHFTAFSFSLNSYIGAAYYSSNYNILGTNEKLKFNTLGVALPIGLNFSVSTRYTEIGAVSFFISAIDLGAVASYRLNNPPSSTTQTLPAFTFQNLLAPGGFIVLNRLFNTPLAFGMGIQRAPQLSNITNTSTSIATDPKWRVGAFLSVDIPLFEIYSKAMKTPLKN